MVAGFVVGQHNAHYQGVYSTDEREWRRICAIDKASHIAELLGNEAGQIASVLEVGCGTGAVLARLSKIGIGNSFTGIDVIDPTINLELDGEGTTGDFSWASYDGEKIPAQSASFDLVYASHVLEHVPEPRRFLKELRRVTSRFSFIEVPCELHGRTNHDALQATLDIGHINFYTPDTFRLLLETSGLEVVNFGTFDHSLAVHQFHASPFRGAAKNLIRKSLLQFAPGLATKVATYHCGALCKPA